MSHKEAQKAQNKKRARGFWTKSFVLFVLLCGFVLTAKGDDGYRLWLRYDQLPSRSLNNYRARIKSISVQGKSATFDAIRNELRAGCAGLLGTSIKVY